MRESNVVSTSAWKTVTFSFSSFFPLTRIGKRKLWIISWRLQILSLTRYLHCVAVDVRSRWCFVVWPSCLASLHPLGSVALLFLSHENQKCLQGLPTLPWGQKKKNLSWLGGTDLNQTKIRQETKANPPFASSQGQSLSLLLPAFHSREVGTMLPASFNP